MELETFLKKCKMEVCLTNESTKYERFIRMLLLMDEFGHDATNYLKDFYIEYYSPTWVNFTRPDSEIVHDLNFGLAVTLDPNVYYDDFNIRIYDIDNDVTYGKGYISAHIRELAKYKMKHQLMNVQDYINLVEKITIVTKPYTYNLIESAGMTITKITIKDLQIEREFKDLQDLIKNF